MSKDNPETENQMALFGLPEKTKSVIKKPKTPKMPQPEPATAPVKTATSAKKKTRKIEATAVPSPPRRGSGLVPEGDIRLTANIREDLHLRLKIAAARQRTTIGEIIENLVEKYV